MFILAKKTKHPEKRKKLQPTETKTVLNIIISAKGGPVFTFSLPGGAGGSHSLATPGNWV